MDEAPASTDMSAGKGADARGETAGPSALTRFFFQESVWLRSDRPTVKNAGGGLTETALTDAFMASRVVQSAAAAGAAGAAGAASSKIPRLRYGMEVRFGSGGEKLIAEQERNMTRTREGRARWNKFTEKVLPGNFIRLA